MALAELVTPLADGRFRCDACQWRCELGAGEPGRCQVRQGAEDGIVLLNQSLISGAAVQPVEEQRLYHFFPDTLALAIGGWGYSFPVDQSHGPYARIPADARAHRQLDPSRVASFALERLCRGVIWSFSEPAVAHEYVLHVLQLSKAASRYTALVTSGYFTPEALDSYGPYLHGMLLNLRAFDAAAYRRLAGIPDWEGILDVALRAQQRWGCHLEVLTRLYPGVNDAPAHLEALAGWIHETLGPATPWHLLPGDAGAEAAASTSRARRLAREAGLQFVYGPEPGQATHCPQCDAVAVERQGGTVRLSGVADGRCAACGTDLNLRLSIFKR